MFKFTEIKADKLQLVSGAKVLKAVDYNHYLGSQDVVEAAQKKANDIIASAEREYKNQQALGFAHGMEQAKQQQAQLLLQTVEQCHQYFASQTPLIAELIMAGMSQLVSEFDDTELTLEMAKKALSTVTNQRKVTLRVNPNLVDSVKEKLSVLLKQFPETSYVDVVADQRVDAGGCLLETQVGVIDATIENQIAAIESLLLSEDHV
ncbi:HrpE/YscL family type III secretion apparatus protein [Pseudoalteromonas sp. MMG024]|uniref:HrpE/YscL family type III secretion apparatus protein n=1 Tax=Pseudoalteromonas sp. MMG024 TaxID=2909980 RepID=UPI001F3456B6|nr:HrpE/YscL family type III secretion apparatus protein [Pseudoalteromonas sp. MMG024]MCF6455672.1 HrpE/YscL family type III secretion apparatus protein [Pseudoalteromonas sp. MMG024]